MLVSLSFFNYGLKKGWGRTTIFTLYAVAYLILCILLIVVAQFKVIGAVTVMLVYLVRMYFLKRFLGRLQLPPH